MQEIVDNERRSLSLLFERQTPVQMMPDTRTIFRLVTPVIIPLTPSPSLPAPSPRAGYMSPNNSAMQTAYLTMGPTQWPTTGLNGASQISRLLPYQSPMLGGYRTARPGAASGDHNSGSSPKK